MQVTYLEAYISSDHITWKKNGHVCSVFILGKQWTVQNRIMQNKLKLYSLKHKTHTKINKTKQFWGILTNIQRAKYEEFLALLYLNFFSRKHDYWEILL